MDTDPRFKQTVVILAGGLMLAWAMLITAFIVSLAG